MAGGPAEFLQHLTAEGYHPRSDKHSNALAKLIVGALVRHCKPIREGAAGGRLVFQLNQTIYLGTVEWNVDLVLGEPATGVEAPGSDVENGILRSPPSTVQIALEIKSVMTEHRKAVKNRKRDFEAHHDHVHRYSKPAIAAGVLVINGASHFYSPLRQGEVTVHKEPKALVSHCVGEFRAVASRSDTEGQGLDAKCALVVEFENMKGSQASFSSARAVPKVGDQLHFDAFLQTICNLYRERFA